LPRLHGCRQDARGGWKKEKVIVVRVTAPLLRLIGDADKNYISSRMFRGAVLVPAYDIERAFDKALKFPIIDQFGIRLGLIGVMVILL